MALGVSADYRSLAQHLLESFASGGELRCLAVYMALSDASGLLRLEAVACWPAGLQRLPESLGDPALQVPEQGRRWLPLRNGHHLLGALLVETAALSWPDSFSQQLGHLATALATARTLDLRCENTLLDLEHLRKQQAEQEHQLAALIHQMRNPLAALRTIAQLLRRRLDQDSEQHRLATSLLDEGQQLERYLKALEQLPRQRLSTELEQPRLLPPFRSSQVDGQLQERLPPLLRRARSSCEASGHPWHQPRDLPRWRGDVDAVAEILANLIENALRYAPSQAPIGLCWSTSTRTVQLLLWDGGPPIPERERERIFHQGQRGTTGAGHQGTGYGLSLGRQLALSLGGDLTLVTQPQLFCSEATPEGNGFLLTLPTSPQTTPTGATQTKP
ncbi:hypothetical protein BO98_01815 [Candidatus Synechococcus spongiarum LMB bulk10D]|nr:hypothetical protein BO98_01815 [Candidatus Synechococcus spongiarum LMB bulk10D]